MSNFATPTTSARRDLHRDGRHLLRLHDVRCGNCSGPAPGWKPEGFATGLAQKLITKNDVYVYDALKTPQFWLHLGRTFPQRHRRHRRPRPSFGHDPGNVSGQGHRDRGGGLRRLAQPVQHARPLLLGLDLGLHRPQEHLLRASSCSESALYCAGALHRLDRSRRLVRAVLRGDHEHVRRRLRHGAGLPQGHVRHALCRRHPRAVDHRLVDGRHLRPGRWSTTSANIKSTTACRRRKLTTPPCTSWPGSLWSASSATSSSRRYTIASI